MMERGPNHHCRREKRGAGNFSQRDVPEKTHQTAQSLVCRHFSAHQKRLLLLRGADPSSGARSYRVCVKVMH